MRCHGCHVATRGTNTVTIPIGSIAAISIETKGGDDTLTIDFSGGDFTVPIEYDGGGQTNGDSISLEGSGSFADVEYSFTGAGEGTISVTGNALITYTGLE